MGIRMAPHLIKAGHDVTVWNRSRGAVEAVEGTEFVFTLYISYAESRARLDRAVARHGSGINTA